MVPFAVLFLHIVTCYAQWNETDEFPSRKLKGIEVSAYKLKWCSQTWWSFVFPNTGFIIAMIDIGTAINSQGILWTASVATVVQIAMWLLVLVAHTRAVLKKQILWPGKDEDDA